jgi:hypothetical protein
MSKPIFCKLGKSWLPLSKVAVINLQSHQWVDKYGNYSSIKENNINNIVENVINNENFICLDRDLYVNMNNIIKINSNNIYLRNGRTYEINALDIDNKIGDFS